MHFKPKAADADERPPIAALDLRDQGVVLAHVLTLLPAHLRLSDLVREITTGSDDFGRVDRVQRAARDLVGAGLLFEVGEVLLPTLAALRFNEILNPGV